MPRPVSLTFARTHAIFRDACTARNVVGQWAGVTTEEKYLSDQNKIKANYYVNSIADFF